MIKIWLEDKDSKMPTKAYENTACWDFYSIEDVTIPPGEWRYVENGVRMIIPEGYYIRFCTRSSLGFIKDLLVYNGILDSSFSGSLKVKIYNLGKETYTIHKGDKYAQFELLKINHMDFDQIDQAEFNKIEETLVRGSKGWGSSGK